MRKFFTALVVIPLGLIFIIFAVANRHFVTVSFDPFNSTTPTVAVTLPLFVVIIAVAILGVIAGGTSDLVPAAPLAPRARGSTRPMPARRGRKQTLCGRPRRLRRPTGGAFRRRQPAAFTGPPGETSRARRCRTRPVGRRYIPFWPAPNHSALETMSLLVKICGLSTRETLRRRACGWRRHGGFRVLSAVAAAPEPRDRARAGQAGQGRAPSRWR